MKIEFEKTKNPLFKDLIKITSKSGGAFERFIYLHPDEIDEAIKLLSGLKELHNG